VLRTSRHEGTTRGARLSYSLSRSKPHTSPSRSADVRAHRLIGGQSLVEFALITPIVLMLLVVVADFGRIFAANLSIEAAARDAAEIGANEYLANPPGVLSSPASTLDPAAIRVVAEAAGWSGAALVVVGRPATPDGLPANVTIFDPPDDGDPDGAFAAMVGAYAAGLDRGDDPRDAFTAASAAVGSTAAE